MGKCQRHQQRILEILDAYGRISLEDICTDLKVSTATARRYLSDLEASEQVIRVRGGAVPAVASPCYSFSREASRCVAEKHQIAVAASSQIEDGVSLFLDTGTTLKEFAVELARRLDEGRLHNLRIVTNAIDYNDILGSLCQVTLTGGVVRPSRRDMVGAGALQCLAGYRFDYAVLGADAIDGDGALYTTDEDTAAFVRQAIAGSRRTLILADNTKLGRTAYIAYGRLDNARMELVSDAGAPAEFVGSVRAAGAEMIIASER